MNQQLCRLTVGGKPCRLQRLTWRQPGSAGLTAAAAEQVAVAAAAEQSTAAHVILTCYTQLLR